MAVALLVTLCAAAAGATCAGAAADDHGAAFFPEKMRPAMEWVDREAHRDDPFLKLTFRSFQARATVNITPTPDRLTVYAPDRHVWQGAGGAAGGPTDGATYGFAIGKDTWHVVYDPVHRLAYYGEGCCAYARAVLMRAATPAPAEIPRRDLSGVRTQRGIALGMRRSRVIALEGRATRTVASPSRARVAIVYATSLSKKNPSCVSERTFVFARDRLEAIHVLTGC